ncbi:CDP-diacylglycerol--serine O-phosphatidyltransferase [Cerasicoccus arenae]|uniref:CDP-diacylglycerol--serine O-phosphatidyltransferase n=1 Tax=Cerasicoccus arenae TaxID=424488 RepID=A0A8J3DBR3_9BACT|nr:CDP-diacylglycerol--serine O-phosphatidyltransferase [Cerasicoccus arenae]MBK1858202.1 CDP-diacylglycerol--serine O-phosphatidyltransferase [Cerasicoccus arenae]GHC01881.1 CDP-diacylglycerol--serine O-phosphatidyltransferase [Cerasicoccus arenae]
MSKNLPDKKPDTPSHLPYRDVNEAARIYILPNLFTAGNLFFGFLAIIWCIRGRYDATEAQIASYFTEAVFFILGAGLCDMLDGRVARLGGRESLFGKEFDSIADMVSFGLAPCLMMFFLILNPTEGLEFFRKIGWLIGFVYLLCAGVRLARFNVITNPFIPGSEKGASDFQGLPAPAAAGMVSSIVLVLINFEFRREFYLLLPPLMLLIAWMMVSNVRYPSFKHLGWQSHLRTQHFIALIIGVALLVFFWQFSFALLFMAYLFFGVGRHLRKQKKAKAAAEKA